MNEQMYLSIARWLISGKESMPAPPKVEEEDDLDLWKLNMFRTYSNYGALAKCSQCGKTEFCSYNALDQTTECVYCAIKRIEQSEKKNNFNYEDFCKL